MLDATGNEPRDFPCFNPIRILGAAACCGERIPQWFLASFQSDSDSRRRRMMKAGRMVDAYGVGFQSDSDSRRRRM